MVIMPIDKRNCVLSYILADFVISFSGRQIALFKQYRIWQKCPTSVKPELHKKQARLTLSPKNNLHVENRRASKGFCFLLKCCSRAVNTRIF